MRILNIHIDNFGKMHDFDMDFSVNPVIVLEDNGWGKSTMAAFIRVMFYGFNGESKKKNSDKERIKYKPWNKEMYGGRIIFEAAGREYELTRHFGIKERDDSGSIVLLETMLDATQFDYKNVGERLFGIDSASFARTLFLGQGNISVFGDNEELEDSIAAKIGNLTEATDDVNCYESVKERLRISSNELKRGYRMGVINELEATKNELTGRLISTVAIEKSVKEIQSRLDEEEKSLEECKKQNDKLTEEMELAAVKGEFRQWEKNINLLVQERHQLEERMKNEPHEQKENVPSEDELERQINNVQVLENCIGMIKDNEFRWELTKSKAESEIDRSNAKMQRQYEEARHEYEEQLHLTKRSSLTRTTVISVAAAVLVLAAIAPALFGLWIYAAVAGGIGILTAAVCIPVSAAYGKRAADSLEKPVKAAEVTESSYDFELDRMERQTQEYRKRVADYENNIKAFFNKYDIEYSREGAKGKLYALRENIKNSISGRLYEYENMKRGLEELDKKIAVLQNTEFDTNPKTYENVRDAADISEEKKALERKCEEKKKVIESYTDQLEALKEKQDRLSEDEIRLEEINECLLKYNHKYDIINKTARYLDEAKARLTSRYMNPIAEAFGRYYGYINEADVEDYDIDAHIVITKKEMGERRDTSMLSTGYRDLIDVALRMALIDAMYPGEKPFVVLDDPFVNLDTEKLNRAREYLKILAEDYQVIYFTCHESRA